jgi:predicted CxxxxCH...CXXCH cytochrome family protein
VDSSRPAEVVFSGAASANGATPTYSGGTCVSTPCHGAVFPRGHASGGTNTSPTWTRVDGTEAGCGACHGLPPPAPHPLGDLNPVCSACHENIAPDNTTFLRPDLHVNGTVTFEVP